MIFSRRLTIKNASDLSGTASELTDYIRYMVETLEARDAASRKEIQDLQTKIKTLQERE